ncbi:MAG: cytochrome c3 family protein [bacterium]
MRLHAFLVALLLAPVVALHAQAAEAFPHARHAKLFPVCSSCHASIALSDSARMFPPVALCANCHDGAIKPRVSWTGPRKRGAELLVFSHLQHSAKAVNTACESCHALDGSKAWMNVSLPVQARCASCHAHGATAHLDEKSNCATCHRTLVKAVALTDARIAAIRMPPSHSRVDFQGAHGGLARANPTSCATCHARESCQRCHVDAASQPLIAALGSDARIARFVAGKPATYTTPSDHRMHQFALLHGSAARTNIARCATCHTRTSCESCHTGEGAREVIRRLPNPKPGASPGVQLRHTPVLTSFDAVQSAPVSLQVMPELHRIDTAAHLVRVHPTGFAKAHGAAAASGVQSCASCHSKQLCASCHTGERVTRRYHAANFVATHAPQAYSRETDCSSCHSTEAFCRDCHRQTGLSSKAAGRSASFHNAAPLWRFQHGSAARQDLKGCASCHQQTYCMQCHSDLGSRINPHGPDFDAARMSRKNPALCLYCHLKNPLAP